MALANIRHIRNGSVLIGQDNIEKAMKLAQSGTPEVAVSDHQSDSDHAIKRFMFESNGFHTFANSMLYLGGLKMIERWDVRQFSSSENMLLIPTPYDIENVDTALNSNGLTEDQKRILTRLRRNYANLSTKAIRSVNAYLSQNNEAIIGLYPESTRSRTGFIGEAKTLANIWYRLRPGTYIVPIAVEGGDYMHPPGTFPIRRINARVVVGEPQPVEKLVKRAKSVPESEREQFIADYAFSLVVRLMDPKYVPPEKRDYFKQLAAF